MNLHYQRLQLGLDTDALKDVLVQSGVGLEAAEAALAGRSAPLEAVHLARGRRAVMCRPAGPGHGVGPREASGRRCNGA